MIYKTKTKWYPQNYLGSRPDVFAVDSEIVKGLVFATENDMFYVMKGRKVMYCPITEVEELISMCTDEALQEEMKEIADDMIQYDRGGRQYAKFCTRGKGDIQ